MVLIIIVTGAYKPTYNWGGPHCWSVVPVSVLTASRLGHAWPMARTGFLGKPASIFRKSIDQLLNFHRNDGWISMDFSDGYTFLSEMEPRHDPSSLSVDFWVIWDHHPTSVGNSHRNGKGKRHDTINQRPENNSELDHRMDLKRIWRVQQIDWKSYPRCEPWWPWCWNIYLHDWVVFGVNVGKYSSTMEHIRYWGAVYWTKAMTRNLRCQLHRRNYHHNGICCCWEALSHRIHVCHIW